MSDPLVTEDSCSTREPRTLNLPAKVTVSLRAGFVLALANIICVAILAWAYMHVKSEANTISVTGSAKKLIQSDLIIWNGKISVNHPDLVQGYDALKIATDKTMAYLKQQGLPEKEIRLEAITTRKNYLNDAKGNPTDKITSYDLEQTIEIKSTDVQKISDVARQVTGLIKEGVMLESDLPKYLYTRIADLKVEMLAEATKDATARAQQIATNSGAQLGNIREARMGVMQINAAHSNDVSGSGNNDTSSMEKEIMAVVSARFDLK